LRCECGFIWCVGFVVRNHHHLTLHGTGVVAGCLPHLASHVMEPCLEDPHHQVGDQWLCDDGCNTCSCDPDGHISAYGCAADAKPQGDTVEEMMVWFASTAVLLCIFFFCFLCWVMCRQKASDAPKRKDATRRKKTPRTPEELEALEEDDY
jgi:hypothetical protein